MARQCKLSVIIPCYNVEEYLSECIDCIKKQSYSDFEVILVDDGSTDGTGKMCDTLAENDSRFRVIHTCNVGSSEARKNGLILCKSDYVTFVDADDFIHPDAYSILMRNLNENEDADIIVYGVSDFIDGKLYHRTTDIISGDCVRLSKIESVLRILDDEEWKSYMFNKIYKKTLFDNIPFPIGRKLDEDLSIMHLVFQNAQTVLYNRSEFYYYRHREGSICLSYDIQSMCKKSFDRINARWERLQFVEAHIEYHSMLNKQRNVYLAVGLAVMRIVAKYPMNFPMNFFDQSRSRIQSVIIAHPDYMARYFNLRKRGELLVLCKLPFLFRLFYKIFPAW